MQLAAVLRLVTVVVLLFPASLQCPLREVIVDTDVHMKLDGEGFHRVLTINVELASMKRLVECSVSLKFLFPAAAYGDFDGYSFDSQDFCIGTSKPFDVEKTAEKSHRQAVYIVPKKKILNSFRFVESFTFPVLLRYHSASRSHNTSVSVKFQSPTVHLSCQDLEYHPDVDDCEKFKSMSPCACAEKGEKNMIQTLCPYILLQTNKPSTIEIVKPVGNLDYSNIVFVGTFLSVFLCVIIVFYLVIVSDDIKCKNKQK